MPKICANSSTPNESLAKARNTLSRSGSPPALQRAASSSQSSWRMEGTRKFIGRQSSEGYGSPQEQYQKVLILLDKWHRTEEHTSELQSLMRISYAVFCLKKKKT